MNEYLTKLLTWQRDHIESIYSGTCNPDTIKSVKVPNTGNIYYVHYIDIDHDLYPAVVITFTNITEESMFYKIVKQDAQDWGCRSWEEANIPINQDKTWNEVIYLHDIEWLDDMVDQVPFGESDDSVTQARLFIEELNYVKKQLNIE